jgi:hypothetical protein
MAPIERPSRKRSASCLTTNRSNCEFHQAKYGGILGGILIRQHVIALGLYQQIELTQDTASDSSPWS